MPTKWLDRTQPQTLVVATIILYINAAFGLLSLFAAPFVLGLILVLAALFGGLGIANERKLGYWVAVGVTALSLAEVVLAPAATSLITLLFQLALLGLLLHPLSRSYKRTWFH